MNGICERASAEIGYPLRSIYSKPDVFALTSVSFSLLDRVMFCNFVSSSSVTDAFGGVDAFGLLGCLGGAGCAGADVACFFLRRSSMDGSASDIGWVTCV